VHIFIGKMHIIMQGPSWP